MSERSTTTTTAARRYYYENIMNRIIFYSFAPPSLQQSVKSLAHCLRAQNSHCCNIISFAFIRAYCISSFTTIMIAIVIILIMISRFSRHPPAASVESHPPDVLPPDGETPKGATPRDDFRRRSSDKAHKYRRIIVVGVSQAAGEPRRDEGFI